MKTCQGKLVFRPFVVRFPSGGEPEGFLKIALDGYRFTKEGSLTHWYPSKTFLVSLSSFFIRWYFRYIQ